MYNIEYGGQEQSFPGRAEAIIAAKELSSSRRTAVKVISKDGTELLIFHQGRLHESHLATIPNRGR